MGELRRLARFRLGELVLAAVTAVGVVVLGVLAGIGVAVVFSLLDLIRRIAHPHDAVQGYVPGVAGMHDVADFDGATQVEGLVVYRYDAPLFFANSTDFLDRALGTVAAAPGPVRWVLLNLEAAVEIDLTAVDTLAELRDTLTQGGVVLALARVKRETLDALDEAGVLDAVGRDRVFATLPTAVAAYAADFEAALGRRPAGLGNGDARGNGLAPR